MKNNGEKNKCDCVNKSICDEKLDKVVGGAVRSTEPAADCHVICNNPKCEHYGHYVSVTVGPSAPGGGYYRVCDFCCDLITTPYGIPLVID